MELSNDEREHIQFEGQRNFWENSIIQLINLFYLYTKNMLISIKSSQSNVKHSFEELFN